MRPRGRFLLIFMPLGVVGAAGFFVFVLGAENFEPAFVNLNTDDAAAVVAELDEAGIPVKLERGGSTIAVPADMVDQTRLLIAGNDVLSGGAQGFELFDQANFGMTEAQQRITYQRALEGELARTIRRMDAIKDARVHIVLPQSSLFSEQKRDATASIVLDVRAGGRLSETQVQAMTNLVVGSVEGLEAENLSIIDTRGELLSVPGSGSSFASSKASASQYQQQQQFERTLAGELRSMLERVLGPGRAAVNVAATMNWDLVEIETESFDPGEGEPGAVRSQRTQSEVSTANSGSGAGGVPGTESNVPIYETSDGQTGTTGYSRDEDIINYELNRTTERTSRAPGTIERLNVAVALDETNMPETVTVEQIEGLIAAAAGINETRGDTLVVSLVPFSTEAMDADLLAFEESQGTEFMFSTARTAGLIVLPLVLLLILWIFLKRAGGRGAMMAAAPQLPSVKMKRLAPVIPGEPIADISVEADTKSKQVREQIISLAESQPSMVSSLISAWIEEDRR